jgi:hypothetical protein
LPTIQVLLAQNWPVQQTLEPKRSAASAASSGERSVVLIGQGVVLYSGQFWALYFLQTVKKLDLLTSSYLVGIACSSRRPR